MANTTTAWRDRPLDNGVRIVTPENIAFEYRVAGPFQRLPAYLIDQVLQWLLLALVGLVASLAGATVGLGGLGLGVAITSWFAMSWFYGGLFEALWNGQTPGKRMARLRVLTIDGQPINAQQAVLRNVLKSVDMLPGLPPYLFALVATMLNERFQRLGDLACGTMVVVEEPRGFSGVAQVLEPDALRLAVALPANLNLTPGSAQALSSYVARRRVLPWARRVEIARHLAEPLALRWGLAGPLNYDALLCAVYQRAFFAVPKE